MTAEQVEGTSAPRVGATRVEAPDVDHVAEGLWALRVPLPFRFLPYVLVYVIETPRGPYLVDAGWGSDEAYETLCAGLERIGTGIGEVQGVAVTHMHGDHYGLASRIREESGCWVALHPADAAVIDARVHHTTELVGAYEQSLVRTGVPSDYLGRLVGIFDSQLSHTSIAMPDVLVEDGATLDAPGRSIEVVWTPGHSPGHVCFWDRDRELLLAGDHVLPRITPNISLYADRGENPLGQYLQSLEKVRGRAVSQVLPAHEWRFVEFQRRVEERLSHHEERLTEILGLVDGARLTGWELAQALSWSHPWESFDDASIRSALGETMAHLVLLAERGVCREVRTSTSSGAVSTWTSIARP